METNSSMLHHLSQYVASILSWCYIFLGSESGFALSFISFLRDPSLVAEKTYHYITINCYNLIAAFIELRTS